MDTLLQMQKTGLKGANINFPKISVGATENALLASFQRQWKKCA